MAKIFQGICTVTPKTLFDVNNFLKLWCHENMRVYKDRCVDNADKNLCDELLKKQIKNGFKKDVNEIFANERIIFGDFMAKGADPRL